MKKSTPDLDEERLLSLFVLKTDDIRSEKLRFLTRPFRSGGYVYALSNNAGIRIPLKAGLCGYEPNHTGVVNYFNIGEVVGTVMADEVECVVKSIPLVDEYETVEATHTCKECGGSGEVEWEYEDCNGDTHFLEYECPVCGGNGLTGGETRPTGKKAISKYACIALGGRFIRARHAALLLEAMRAAGADAAELQMNDFCFIFSFCGVKVLFCEAYSTSLDADTFETKINVSTP